MKILYIGPYRYNNFFGISSRNILEQLNQTNIELFTKHIFINNPYHNTTFIDYGQYEKNFVLDNNQKYDIVIQHAPVEMMYVDSKISSKHIAIPIMDYVITDSFINILNQFDLVLTDDSLHFQNLEPIEHKKLFKYTFNNINNPQHLMNLDYYNHQTKFYFIGNYLSNQNMIHKIIVSFLLANRSKQDMCLVLLLNDEDRQKAEQGLSESIKDIFSKLNYNCNMSRSPIKSIIQPLSMEQLHIIHNTCDIFINLYDSYNTNINYHLANTYGNYVIDIDNTESITVPMIELNDFIISKYKKSVLSNSLIQTIKNLPSKKIPQLFEFQTINQLLCL